MVFVFMKSSYSNKTNNGWAHFRISVGLLVAVFLYMLVGALAFLYLNPTYTSQGSNQAEYETTFLDALYFMTVTITTVGFGDIVPTNDRTKIFLTLYILLSLVLVGVMLEVTDFLFQIDIEEMDDEPVAEDDNEKNHLTRSKKKLFYSLLLVVAVMAASTTFYCTVEAFTFVDALYFSVSTMTTVGYGDLTPTTEEGKVFAIFWIGLGTLTLFRAVGSLLDYVLNERKNEWRKQRDARIQAIQQELSVRVRSMRVQDLSSKAAVEKCSKKELVNLLTKFEFMIYRLEQNGLVSADQIASLEQEFKGMTPEQIQVEFSSMSSSKVFASMA